MQTVVLEHSPVAKSRRGELAPKPSADLAFFRIELQAEPAWVEELNQAAKALGMSRSAYIRMACNRQMAADRRSQRDDAD